MNYKHIRRRDGITPEDDARANTVIDAAIQIELFGVPAQPMPLVTLPVAPESATEIHYTTIIEEARQGYTRCKGSKIQNHQFTFVPFIRLRGRWLERAGFESGNQISVEVPGPGTLIIRKAETMP